MFRLIPQNQVTILNEHLIVWKPMPNLEKQRKMVLRALAIAYRMGSSVSKTTNNFKFIFVIVIARMSGIRLFVC